MFVEVKDDSGHRFVIPFERLADWDEWVQLEPDYDDEESCKLAWTVPDYAQEVGGTVVFPSYEIR